MRHRPLTARDAGLLEAATLGNLNWTGPRFTVDDLRQPEFAHYTAFDGERGDFGIVAELDGRPVGVAWALFLPPEDPGYGYVGAEVPELSLWVAPDHRGRGVGRDLLRSLLDDARDRDVPAVSLSVEAGNRARALYTDEGFTDVPGREAAGVMLRALTPAPAPGRAASAGDSSPRP